MGNRRVRVVATSVATIVLIVAPFAFYIVSYTQSKKSQLTQRDLRILAQVEQGLNERLARFDPMFLYSRLYASDTIDTNKLRELAEWGHEVARQQQMSLERSIERLESRRALIQAEIEKAKQAAEAPPPTEQWLATTARKAVAFAAQRGEEPEGVVARQKRLEGELERIKKAVEQERELLDEAQAAKPDESKEASAAPERVLSYLEGLRRSDVFRSIEFHALERRGESEANGEEKGGDGEEACPERDRLRFDFHKRTRTLDVIDCYDARTRNGGSRADLWNGHYLKATVPFADVLAPELGLEAFEQLLVFGSDGSVLYQTGSSLLRFANVRSLLSGSRAHPTTSSDDEGASASAQVGRAPIDLAGDQPSSGRSFLVEIEMGGSKQLVFVRPLALSPPRVDGHEPLERWYLAGVVPLGRFNQRASEIPLTVLLGVTSLLLLGLAAWPWLKLWSISHEDPISSGDAFRLVSSLLIGAGVVALIVLDTVSLVSLHDEVDDTAERVADRILRSFRSELVDELEALDGAEKTMQAGCPAGAEKSKLAIYARWPKPGVYPDLELAFLLDGTGSQVGPQLLYQDGDVQRIRVPKRAYFQRARAGDLWALEHGGRPRRFFIERVATYDLGIKRSILSAPAGDGANGTESDGSRCKAEVVALSHHFTSFASPVLPLGFGFAVFSDETGKVLYHSADRRSLVETFPDETDVKARLQAVSATGVADHFWGQYHGSDHRFYARPVPDVPWTLVVFFDSRVLETANFDTVLTAGGSLLLYVLLFVLGVAVLVVLGKTTRWTWLWPRPGLEERYSRLTGFALLLGVACGVGIWRLDGWWLSILVVAVPPLFLSVAYLVLRENVRRFGAQRRWAIRVGATSGMFVAFCIAATAVDPGSALLVLPIALVELGALRCASGRGADPSPGRLQGVLYVVVAFVAILAGQGVRYADDWPSLVAAGAFSLALWRQRPVLWPWKNGREEDRALLPGRFLEFAVASAVLLAVVPTVAVFSDAYRTLADGLTRSHGLETSLAHDRRTRALQADAEQLRPKVYAGAKAPRVGLRREAACRGVYAEAGFLSGDNDGVLCDPSAHAYWCELLAGDPTFHSRCERAVDGRAHGFSQLLAANLPRYNDETTRRRPFLNDRADDCAWVSERRSDEVPFCRLVTGTGAPHQIRSRELVMPAPRSAGQAIAGLFFLVLALGTLTGLIRAFCKRVFGVSVPDYDPAPDPIVDEKLLEGRFLLIRPSGAFREKLQEKLGEWEKAGKCQVVDLTSIARAEDVSVSRRNGRSRLVLRGFAKATAEPWRRREVLKFLEARVRADDASMLIVSDFSPLRPLGLSAHPFTSDDPSRPTGLEAIRWSRLWSYFSVERFATRASEPERSWRDLPEPEATILRECGWSGALHATQEKLLELARKRPGRLGPEEVLAEVASAGEAYFRSLWLASSNKERLLLVQMAQGNLPNPMNREVLYRLLQRGLVRRDPEFRLVSQGFARFVLSAESDEQFDKLAAESAAGAWASLRIPVLAVLLMVFAFLAYSGGDTVLATVPAVAVAVSAAIRMIDTFRGGRASGAG